MTKEERRALKAERKAEKVRRKAEKKAEKERRKASAMLVDQQEPTVLHEATPTDETFQEIVEQVNALTHKDEEKPVEEEESTGKKLFINESEFYYSRSFEAKLIQSGDEVQEKYETIRNHFMSYKGIKLRSSFSNETFYKGRKPYAYILIKGKTLNLYLALNPKEFEGTKYHFEDASGTKKYEDVPMRLKLKSNLAVKYALELIDMIMIDEDIEALDTPANESYRFKYKTDEQLLEIGLVKKIFGKPSVKDEDDIPLEEQVQIEAPEAVTVNFEVEEGKSYSRSFEAKLIQAEDDLQRRYGEIKNHLLSYDGVKSRISWAHEVFWKGREKLVHLVIKGKTLSVYLALDPKEFEGTKYHFDDESETKKYEDTPMRVKVKSDRATKYAIELIDILAGKKELNPLLNPEVLNYKRKYESDQELLKKGLVRLLAGKKEEEEKKQAIDVIYDEEGEVLEVLSKEYNSDGNLILNIRNAQGVEQEYFYSRSFEATLIQSSDNVQDYYEILKNHIYAFSGVESKMTWNQETFKVKGRTVIMLMFRGKTLNIFFALGRNEYQDIGFETEPSPDEERFAGLPMRYRIRGYQSVKNAAKLIDSVMDRNGVVYLAEETGIDPDTDYHRPYEPIEHLVTKGLAHLVPRKVRDDEKLSGVEEDAEAPKVEEPVKEEPVKEQEPPKEEPLKEEPSSQETEALEDEGDDEEETLVGEGGIRYSKSFLAKLIQSGDEVQGRYETIRNHFMSYKDVKMRSSFTNDTFYKGRKPFAFVLIKGKTLNLYLSLNPKDYEESKYHFEDASLIKKYSQVPMRLKIKSNLALKYALELIDVIMESEGIKALDTPKNESYRYPYESNDALIEKGLIKVVSSK